MPPRLLSFDVFGTLISVREGSYNVFRSILADSARSDVHVQEFWEYWEERNIAHYWERYRPYKEICELSLGEAFAHFGIRGNPSLIRRYFDAFCGFELYPDVLPTLDALGRRHRLAIVSNIDDDLLVATPLCREFDLVCTAQRARGYKPDGTLFRYLMAHSVVARDEILHVGRSQFTDLVGGKPLGLTIAWINRCGVDLHPSVPRPDFIFADLASLVPLLDGRAIRND
ncbi:MAG TPA: HAD hydrolase-like protein [Pseudolabrys sp.]|nr:HAD hydrolase-like protein [Pseudolabrys sp.]